MANSSPLSSREISDKLKQIPTWFIAGNTITKAYTFPNFAKALKFVNQVGEIAEKLNHHPEISLTWGKVIVTSTTHEPNGLTEKDFTLAHKIDTLKTH